VIDRDILERVLSAALKTGAEFAEVFASDWRGTGVALDDGRIEQMSTSRSRGAGIRVIKGETTGFAHTADLSEAGLLAAARAAAQAASQGAGGIRVVALESQPRRVVSPVEIDPSSIAKTAKVDLLRRVDDAARSAGAAIAQVSAGYSDGRSKILVANSDGLLAEDERVRSLLRVSAVANGDTGMQTGFDSLGHTMGFELFDKVSVEDVARTAATRALTKLKARPAPSGTMPVVIKAGSGGVLFHEACGH
jgi:TldD protein